MNYLFPIIFAIGFIKNCSTQNSTMNVTSTTSTESSTFGITSNIQSSISTSTTSRESSTFGITSNIQSSISISQSSLSTTLSAITTPKNTATTVASISSLNISEVTSPFWVQTVCNITITTDITTAQFKSDMELKLSNAYAIAYASIQTSGRRRRATTNGANTLQLVSIARITSGQVPTNLIYYIVSSDKSFVTPSTIIRNMNQLSLQQMSIYLGIPVTTVATYYNSATQNPSTDEKLWIIGAVFGSLAAVALIIWLVLFVYSRCIRPWDEPLILKSSVDLEEENVYSTEYSKSINKNYETTVIPMVGTIEEKTLSNSKTKYKSDKIEKEHEKDTKREVKHERIENYNKFVEIVNSQIENKSMNEIIIKHVFEEKPRKHRKKDSSTSSSDSDSSSISKKSKKKNKLKEVKIKDKSEKEKTKKSKGDDNKKSKKKKSSNEITEKTVINEECFVSSTADTTMAFHKNEEIGENLNDEEIIVVEKMSEILKKKIEKLPKVEDDFHVPAKERLQSPQLPEKLTVNVIEVQPKSTPTDDISKYQLIEPKPVVNNYDHLRMFPSYSEEIYLDTSLNFVKLKSTDLLEIEKSEMNQSKSKKNNLRTLDPLPSGIAKKN